eukprot:6214624-Pleurochrysis_carterae.AAC.1
MHHRYAQRLRSAAAGKPRGLPGGGAMACWRAVLLDARNRPQSTRVVTRLSSAVFISSFVNV